MVAPLNRKTAALLLCILLSSLSACAPVGGVALDAQADTASLQVTPSLQHELTQLMYCYATGVDLAGAGDGEAAAQHLRSCFTDDAESVYEFPPAWAHLNFTATRGGAGLAQVAIEFYRHFGFTRTQLFFRVELPVALPEILLGINQTILMSLSMIIICAMIGTRDLGQEVFKALAKADAGKGIVAGLCIAFIGMIADRLITAWAARLRA